MIPKPSKTLYSRLEARFDNLAAAKFATFHEVVRLFFKFFDKEEILVGLSATLAKSVPYAENIAMRYEGETIPVTPPESEEEAAAVAELVLRRIAESESVPRPFYNNIFNRGNPSVQPLPFQADNDERSLIAVKDRFLRPFRTFVLEALPTDGPSDDAKAIDPAHLDSVTGLLGKGAFTRDLQSSFTSAHKDKSPLAMIMIDLDHFKPLNDTLGHPMGDVALKGVSTLIQKAVKNRGTAYRWGGDEFSVLLPNHTASDAVLLAERIRAAVADAYIPTKNLFVTLSVGVAEIQPTMVDCAELEHNADQAQIVAKKSRDLVRIFGEPPYSEEEASERVPLRKQPSTQDSFDDDQRDSIRLNFFQSGLARCPFDSAKLEVEKLQIDERRTPDLLVRCPICGRNDMISGPQ